MPRYRMRVTVIAEASYNLDVDASSEDAAERLATSQHTSAANLPEDFQVDKGYCTFKCETEALTADCPGCGTEHPIPHDDLRICHCGAIGVWPGRAYISGGSQFDTHIPHLVVNGICTPAPWFYEDQDYCAACGVLELAKEAAA